MAGINTSDNWRLKIREELSKLKYTFDCHFRADKDYDLRYTKQINELKKLIVALPSKMLINKVTSGMNRTVLREFLEDYKLRHSTGRDEIQKIIDKLGGEKTVVRTSIETNSYQGQSTMTDSKPPSCVKCGNEMEMDINTLNSGNWYCRKCDHFSVKNPSEQDLLRDGIDYEKEFPATERFLKSKEGEE